MVWQRVITQAVKLPQAFVCRQGPHRDITVHDFGIHRRLGGTDYGNARATATNILDTQSQVV